MKRIISIVIFTLLLFSFLPRMAFATSDSFSIGQTWDDSIFAGGIYDMYAWVEGDSDDYTFQWQVDAGIGTGSWVNLDDNADPYGYTGTNTYHLQMITPRTNGYIIGTGWEDIPFHCVITHKATGVSKTTASMFMNVFTSDDLEEFMAEKGIELYEPSISGVSNITTTDDVTYYASTAAGKSQKYSCGFNPLQNNLLMGRSDMLGDVEVWITENGTTVKRENGTNYMPYTIGKDAVTIQFKYHYTLGIHDMGYYQIKTVKLTTNEPEVVGRGSPKQDISLLKEPYSQSQKLLTIPKGQTVHIHNNSGSWYQVSYNGYIGYVAGSSLNSESHTPVIDHVKLSVAEPVAGAIPATTCTVSPSSCEVTYMEWYDKTAEHYMEPGEKFQKGHTYQLVVWATAKEGYEFKLDSNDTMLTTAVINENLPAFTSRAYEQIIGKVIDIRYDFHNVKDAPEVHICNPVLVTKVEPTCTKTGFQAYYACNCGLRYSDSQGKHRVDLNTWGKIPALGHLETAYQADSDMHYKFCGRPACGEDLTEYRGKHSGGTATCQETAKCQVCGYGYGEIGDHDWITDSWLYKDEQGHAHGCQNPGCNAYEKLFPHTPGPEATVSSPQLCADCGYILKPAGNHTHKLTKVDGISATCLAAGNQAYYTCDGCEDWFWDSEATEKIPQRDDVILEPLGHFSETWQSDEAYHWQICVICTTETIKEAHSDSNQDKICDICDGKIDTIPTPSEPEATESNDTQPDVTENKEKPATSADSQTKPGKTNTWYLWVLVFLAIFAASVTTTVIILKMKNKP